MKTKFTYKYFLFFILLMGFYSCGDDSSSTCNPSCETWQNCNTDNSINKCVAKEDYCMTGDDCSYTEVCDDTSHKCIEDDICRPICDTEWQKCEDKQCITKDDFCKDDFECLNGYKCILDNHKCMADCDSTYDECELSEKFCDSNNLKSCEETLCGTRYTLTPCEANEICSNAECINPDCVDECDISDNSLCSGYNKLKVCEQTECGKKFKEVVCDANLLYAHYFVILASNCK